MIKKYLSIGGVTLKKISLIYFLMIIAAILEVASIGLILPIFQFLVDGDFSKNIYIIKLSNLEIFNFISLYDDKLVLLLLTLSIIIQVQGFEGGAPSSGSIENETLIPKAALRGWDLVARELDMQMS